MGERFAHDRDGAVENRPAARSREEIIEFLIEQAACRDHRRVLDPCDASAAGGNPGCGDVVTVFLRVDRDADAVTDAAFVGEGCTISQAAASVLVAQVRGVPLARIEEMDANDVMDSLGREVVKSRPRCATLALSTLKGAVRAYRARRVREEIGAPPEARPPAPAAPACPLSPAPEEPAP